MSLAGVHAWPHRGGAPSDGTIDEGGVAVVRQRHLVEEVFVLLDSGCELVRMLQRRQRCGSAVGFRGVRAALRGEAGDDRLPHRRDRGRARGESDPQAGVRCGCGGRGGRVYEVRCCAGCGGACFCIPARRQRVPKQAVRGGTFVCMNTCLRGGTHELACGRCASCS